MTGPAQVRAVIQYRHGRWRKLSQSSGRGPWRSALPLRRMLPFLLLAAACLATASPARAQATGGPLARDIAQGTHCLQLMERDAQGALEAARLTLEREDASEVSRVMALACVARTRLMTGEGDEARTALQELQPLLGSTQMPGQLRVEMRLMAATALQELGELQQAGDVLESALAESEPYTNLHIQALVAIALHHARGLGGPEAAVPWFERAIAATATRPGGQAPIDAIPHFNYGLAMLELGRAEEAAGLLEQARVLAGRDRHLDRLRGRIEGAQGRLALEQGELAAGRTRLGNAVGLQRAMEDAPGLASSLRYLAEIALLEGMPEQALDYATESVALVERGQMRDQLHPSLELMARVHAALGDPAQSRAWSERARLHLAELNREREAAAGAALEAHAPRADASIEDLGNLTRARVIGLLATLALAATLLIGGWILVQARRHQRQLARSSATDALTGLANRRATAQRLDALPAAVADGPRAALLLLDIDHFKKVNDEHGHEMGDRVLVALADCLRAACDANDVVARWGGEEFLVLRPQTSRAAAHALAEHIRAAVERLVIPLPGGQATSVTVSIGLASCPYFPGQEDWQGAVRMADRALYAAKHSGRNAWAATWGEAAGMHVDVYSVRNDPEAAVAQGWISIAGSRPISWSAPRDADRRRGADVGGDGRQSDGMR